MQSTAQSFAPIAQNIANLFAAIGVTLGSIGPGGVVLVSGVVLVGGMYLMAKAGEKTEDVVKTATKRKRFEVCCCNLIGPSGSIKMHFITKSSRKAAEEAARHYGNANGVEYHPHNKTDKFPHFHPTRNGVKIPGIHFQFPSF